MSKSKKPILYIGGGCLNSSEGLKRFLELTGIPVASTFMGLSDELPAMEAAASNPSFKSLEGLRVTCLSSSSFNPPKFATHHHHHPLSDSVPSIGATGKDPRRHVISELKKPVYGNVGGGGGLKPGEGWKRLQVLLLGILFATTLMPSWAYSLSDELSPQMPIIHDTVNANYVLDKSESSIASEVKFGDHVTGKIKASFSRAKFVYCSTDSMVMGNADINTGVGQPQMIMRASTAAFPPATVAVGACFGLAIGLSISAFARWVFPNRKVAGTSTRRGKARKA